MRGAMIRCKMLLFVSAVAVMCAALTTPAHCEEELAPGFNACIDKAASTADHLDCLRTAFDFWDRQLNTNFKQAKADCAGGENAQQCLANLLKAQRAWVQYKEAMSQVVWDMEGGGSNSRLSANSFLVQETKKQALLLKSSGD